MPTPITFNFTLPGQSEATAERWLECWSALYPQSYDEPAYYYLVGKANRMTADDLLILGAWKDGALKKSGYSKGGRFDPSKLIFNGKWSPDAASVAFRIWAKVAQELGGRMTGAFPTDASKFLEDWSEKQDKSGTRNKRFGLSRATTLLHFVSGGRYPIFDSRVRRAIKKLTGITPKQTVEWYLGEFCSIFDELARECAAESNRRKVDKELFAYGGMLRIT